jgi:hypothetical protein
MRRIWIPVMVLALSSGARAQQQAQPMARPSAAKAPLSTSLSVTVGGKTTAFSVAELEAMPQKTLKLHNEHTQKDESYTGVLLSDVLAQCGASLSPETQKKFLHSTVRAIGTDKYFVLYAAAEVEGGLHAGDVIVATKMDGGSLGDDGNLKLISSEEKKPARWVRNLAAIVFQTED